MGVGAVYVSPLLQAAEGSQHGYDVVDHRAVDHDRGGTDGLKALVEACADAGLGIVVDIVPNHMGIDDAAENAAWWDVLRFGQAADHATWFDIEWSANAGRIIVPVLADEADLERDLTISEGAQPEIHYFDHRFPIAPGTYDGEPAHVVHDRQHYELVNFRRADTDLNYRRFFAVTSLAALRVEDRRVFDATHAEILRWVREYGVSGLRIDHPDGLSDPTTYLERLAHESGDAWITVEKIAARGEDLPPDWPVAGMTGYDALAEVNAVMIDPAAEAAATRNYQELTGDLQPWEHHVTAGKRLMVAGILRSEINHLARLVPDVAHAAEALAELVVAFPVYRSYLPRGREHLDHASEVARHTLPELGETIDALLPRLSDPDDELALRFQQVTGAVMAKGVEDTAHYRYTRFVALNEVGADPGTFGATIEEFHAAQAHRQATTPRGMTTLSTHDTKRGEDVRARLAVLAELPDEWAEVARYLLATAPVPDRAVGYLLWQTFVATGFIERSRMHDYAQKAMREEARRTGWIDPRERFESVVQRAVDAAYDDAEVRRVITEFTELLEPYGWSNSLSQKLIQLTMPGIPDVYQGTELWQDSLVDPDNRRPVDFARRENVVANLPTAGQPAPDLESLPRITASGDAKLWVTMNALRARRDRADLFTMYQPIVASDSRREHLIAFDRGGAVTLATRRPVALDRAGGWGDATVVLPGGRYVDALTGRSIDGGEVTLSGILDLYPVALLLRAHDA